MSKATTEFAYPADIELQQSPLAEAWLEIRWLLDTIDPKTGQAVDPLFPIALGRLYDSIKERFGYSKELDAAILPVNMSPYVVRHQFRPAKEEWPLIQIGPGVASINYDDHYTWDTFLNDALYLRSALLNAYGESGLQAELLALRYKNAEPFEYTSNSLLDFLRNNLNTSLELPKDIPGDASDGNLITSANVFLTFDLEPPPAIGSIRIATGKRKSRNGSTDTIVEKDIILWQLEIISKSEYVPSIQNEEEFVNWLDDAHRILHDWFFSSIEGPLRKKYEGEE